MLKLHKIGMPILDDFEKWYIVRKLDDDIKNDTFRHVPEISPSQSLFMKYRELAHSHRWNKQTFTSIYLPCFLTEMKQATSLSILQELVDRSHLDNIALCCYCDDESICHRSIVGGILKGMGADIEYPQEYLRYYEMFHELHLSTC